MWKNWNPFKRKAKDEDDTNNEQTGKENSNNKVRVISSENGHVPMFISESSSDSWLINGKSEESTVFNKTLSNENDLSLLRSPLRLNARNRAAADVQSNFSVLSGLASLEDDSKSKKLSEDFNRSFSGVHGPLLSSPIVPKVRRALETNMGLRSPQNSRSCLGKPVGRSMSLHFGASNPTSSTAGQLPWVRLKRRESIGLSDLVGGNTPMSPNTIKLSVPEKRQLPAAPSFKSTPLIITTEANRTCVVDTQTVVSALREKRKRFGQSHQDDTLNEDNLQTATKRRRQDSSQSNASSVSMPPMPETLPNLIGAAGASLLHIESLADQRPSTVPSLDTFITRHQRMAGLGGQAQQFYPVQQCQPTIRSSNNSKTVLRSIQSSLSSSQRAMANLSALNQHGIDNQRLRSLSQTPDTVKKMVATPERRRQEQSLIQPAVTNQQAAANAQLAPDTQMTSTAQSSLVSTTGADSIKQQIAEGVVLRRHDLTFSHNASPLCSLKTSPGNLLVSSSDLEMDRQREYKKRVLDLLDGEDSSDSKAPPTSSSLLSTSTGMTMSSTAMSATLTGMAISSAATSVTPTRMTMSSAATSAAVSASLDSLKNLVQSTSSLPISHSSTANTLSELLNTTEESAQSFPASSGASFTLSGKLLDVPSSAQSLASCSLPSYTETVPDGGFNFTAGVPVSSIVPNLSKGFKFDPPAVKSGETAEKPGTSNGVSFSLASSLATSSAASVGPAPGNSLVASSAPGSFGAPSMPSSSSSFIFMPVESSSAKTAGLSSSFGQSTAQQGIRPFQPASLEQPSVTSSGGPAAFTCIAPACNSGSPFTFGMTEAPTSSVASQYCLGAGVTSSSAATTAANVFGFGKATASLATGSSTVFDFGQTAAQTTSAPTTVFGFGQAVTQSTSAPTTVLGFGQAVTQSASAPTTVLGFGQAVTQSTTALGFGQAVTQSTSAPTTIFGFGKTTAPSSTQATTFGFGPTSAATNATFGFGQANATQTNVMGFGKATMPASSTATVPGFGQTAAPSSTPFSFGQTSSQSTPLGFGFGPTSAAVANTSSTSFNFGKALSSNNNSSTTSMAGFGQTGMFTFTQATPTNVSTASLGFGSQSVPTSGIMQTFNLKGASSSNSNVNYNQVNSTTADIYGQAIAPALVTPQTGFNQTAPPASTTAFGQSSQQAPAPFAFGNSAGASSGSGAFKFGQATNNNAAKPFTFGLPATQPNSTGGFGSAQASSTSTGTSVFGASSGFNFGTTATGFGSSDSSSTPAPFAFTAATTSAPAFGSTPSAFGVSSTGGSLFGATANKPFSFGTAATSTATSTTSFGTSPANFSIFGAKTTSSNISVFGVATTSTASSAFGSISSPGFGASSSTQPSAFGAAPPAFGSAQPMSAFGSTGACLNPSQTFGSMTGASNPPVIFGASTTQPSFNFSAQPKPTVGFGAPPQSNGGYNFGQSAVPQPAANGAFNFAAQTPPRPQLPTPSPAGYNFGAYSTPGAVNFSAVPSTPQNATRPRVAARRVARRVGPRR